MTPWRDVLAIRDDGRKTASRRVDDFVWRRESTTG
jgi:hypothetical protein